jgi:hypothetical protein
MSTQTKTVKFQTFPEMIKFQNQVSKIVNSVGTPMFTTTPNFTTKTINITQLRESKIWIQWLNKLPTDKYFTLGLYGEIQLKGA